MKRFLQKGRSACRLAATLTGIILSLFVLQCAAAETVSVSRVSATITLSADAASIGKEISARYEITGGSGEYTEIYGTWVVEDSATDCGYHLGGRIYTEASGEASFVPRFGDTLYFQLEGTDSCGIPFLAFSDEIEISGEADYPVATITLSADAASIGEEISACYEITGGSGEYTDIYGTWVVEDSATDCGYHLNGRIYTEASGEASFVPRFGDSLCFQLEGTDSYGVPFLTISDEIEISGEADYPVATITLSAGAASIGEEISACYEITGGSGEYTDIFGTWVVEDSATDCSYHLDGRIYTEASGEASFAPRFGDSLCFQLEGTDSYGVPFLAFSDEIEIRSVAVVINRIVYIPDSVQIIESEAFRGVPLDAACIPQSVISIAADAFDSGVLLILENDSLAEWAEENGLDYIVGFEHAPAFP